MKSKALAAIGVFMTAVTLAFAATERAVDRPPGIAADQWFPIGDHLGLVVSDYQPGLDPLIDSGPMNVLTPPRDTGPSPPLNLRTTRPTPALTGYLMIKQAGHWTRLSVVSPPTCPPGTDESCLG